MWRIFNFAVSLAFVPSTLLGQETTTSLRPAAVVKTYCVSCHSGQARQGGFSLDRIDISHPAEDAGAWERVVRQLRARTMPPMGSPRPNNNTYESTISALADAIDRQAAPAKLLSDRELAIRLASRMWNTEPDQLLHDAVAKATLHDPQILQAQVRRMLADSRASALVTGFFGTWLELDQLATMKGDTKVFPEFDDDLRRALRRETDLFVQSQLRDDRNAVELWTSNYTFLNERLARHYGVSGVSGSDFRRVAWPGSERAGLLGQGSILTLTSYPYNAYPVDAPTTSPAQRGKWILGRMFGVNPPGTLPGVPAADYPFQKQTPLVQQSRAFPAKPCQTCHRSFFPLAHGLENFDVLGRWRADYGPDGIDASGTLVDGTAFNGPVEFRGALLERRDAFLNVLMEKLVAYAGGGPAAIHTLSADASMPAIRAALRDARNQNYSWSSLIAAAFAKAP